MAISVVATLYKSAPYIREFCARTNGLDKLTADYEIVFVDDGSPDDSLRVALYLVAEPKILRSSSCRAISGIIRR